MSGFVAYTGSAPITGSASADNAYRAAPDSTSPTYSWGGSFGRTCVPFVQNPLMTDTLRPNAFGQAVKYEQVSAIIRANA